jgi:hypothetical protein
MRFAIHIRPNVPDRKAAQAQFQRAWCSHVIGRGRIDQDGYKFHAFAVGRFLGTFSTRIDAETAVHEFAR